MKLRPYPHQFSGAQHLATKNVAGLFDDPRVGKNLSTIMALDDISARKILFITTVSGRAVFRQAVTDNQRIPRKVRILSPKDRIEDGVSIISWAAVNNAAMRAKLLAELWDVIVVDEAHYAKSFTAKRTRALYGQLQYDGRHIDQNKALVARAQRVWLLTGTPLPHDLSDAYPMLRGLAPELLLAQAGMPDVTTIRAFDDRYTIQKLIKPTPHFSKWIKVGGKNEAELKQRMQRGGFFLRRTQAQIGILPPRFSLRPLICDDFDPVIEEGMDRDEIIEILENGRQYKNLSAMLHQHGIFKAHAVVEAVNEEFDCGLDKIVLGYWHHDVGEILEAGLHKHGVVGINGQTPPPKREGIVRQFSTPGGPKVFLQQLAAASESIDLSASSLLWFVESVFQPATMKQAAERVTNLNNRRAPVVETTFIEGSIDELIQGRLMTLWASINRVIERT